MGTNSGSNVRQSDGRRVAAAAAVLASLVGAFASTSPAGAEVPAACTITGTPRADVLRGTSRADVICGLGGNDVIYGAGGNDVIRGGEGNDRNYGDGGNDIISGDAGNDSVSGGIGDDRLNGGVGNDQVSGDDGTDVISGDAGNDSVNGDGGSDTVNGDSGTDSVSGGVGNDVLNGGVGNDQVSGGTGDDALMGGAGTDQIYAGTGADTCAADSADRVSGACTVDKTGPAVAWISAPSAATAGETFTATFSLKDPSSIDPNSPNATIGGAPGWITSWCGFPVMASLVSGTNADGVWSVTCPVPANAVSDPYSLWISAQDSFGNSAPRLSADFRVVGGASDNKAPVISDVAIPASAKPGETISLTWRAADPSGVKDTPYPWVYRPAPQFGVIYGAGVEAPVRTSGTAFDGAYSQTLTLPASSVKGTYPVYISVRDELGNKTYEYYGSFTVS